MLKSIEAIGNGLESTAIDFYEVFGPFIGKDIYLALNEDYSEVIASGRSIAEAVKNSEENGYYDPIITKAPDNDFGCYVL